MTKINDAIDNLYKFAQKEDVIDTPISDEKSMGKIRDLINSTDLEERLLRTNVFIDYLVDSEREEFKTYPEYLHFEFTNEYFAEEIFHRFKALEKDIIENYRLRQKQTY
jgi:hypothetical protein